MSTETLYLAQLLGFAVGFCWGEIFSRFDGMVKYNTQWYKSLGKFEKWLVASLLDATHHFQWGLLLMLLSLVFPFSLLQSTVLFWVGCGLIASDWKDYKNVLRRFEEWKRQ